MPGLHLALLGFTLGTIALQWQAELVSPRWCFAAAVGIGVAALAAGHAARRVARGVSVVARVVAGAMVLACLAIAGFGYASWRADLRLADALPEAWENVDLDVIGVVDELPGVSPRGTRFAFAVERVLTPEAVVPTRVSLGWFPSTRDGTSEVPLVRAGERWRLTVRLKRPHGTVNPHGFDLEAWLLQNELRATGYVRLQGNNMRIDAFAGRPGDYVQRARENVRDRALAALGDAKYAGVIVALAIGEQRAIPESHWLVFNRTGVTHQLSISGARIPTPSNTRAPYRA